jgi:hypothetical protein
MAARGAATHQKKGQARRATRSTSQIEKHFDFGSFVR